MLSKNMGTSVAVIEAYYGKHATAVSMATSLGGHMQASKKNQSPATTSIS
jgi:hypothetical protein